MPVKQIHDQRYRELVASLKEARKAAGLTQADVAGRLGLCRTWVAKVEQAELGLDLLHFVLLCRVLGLSAQKMLESLERPP